MTLRLRPGLRAGSPSFRWAAGLLLSGICAAFCPAVLAGSLRVTVRDARQQPVAEAVIVATGETAAAAAHAGPAAVMDQIHKAFVPNVLVVRTGAAVVFPNSDTIAHQVYSFSSPKRFKLPLYRGHPHPPVRFDTPGLVVLGCNIHDRMVGYIFVTDSAWFGTSDTNGQWLGDLPPGKYRISVWTPHSTREAVQFEQQIVVTEAPTQQLDVRLSRTMTPTRTPEQDPRVREY